MKQIGLSQEEIDASKVIIEKTDGNKIIFDNPSIVKMNLQGQDSFQVSGDFYEEPKEKFSEEDIKTIVEKTGCSEKEARETLEQTQDLAEAILKLTK